MDSADVLCTLRGLNRLSLKAHQLPEGSPEREALEARAGEMHDWLPTAIADHHDSLARSGRLSLAATDHGCCSVCESTLDPALVVRLRTLGRFGVCPSCQVLLCSPETMGTESRLLVEAGRSRRR